MSIIAVLSVLLINSSVYAITPEEVSEYMISHIERKAETTRYDYWQTPEETIKLGTGDCEDFTFLAYSLLKKSYKCYIVRINAEPKLDHMILVIDYPKGRKSYFNNGYLHKPYTNKIEQIIRNIYRVDKSYRIIEKFKYGRQ